MKKQAIALVASGLLLASGMTFAQQQGDIRELPKPAAGSKGAHDAGTGSLANYRKPALIVATGGLAAAAATDDGDGSGTSTSTTTATQTN